MTPTGEEIFEAADVMAAAFLSSMLVAVVGRKAQRAMLALADKGEDFRDRGIFRRLRLHRGQTLGKDARAMKQILIKRPHPGETLLVEHETLANGSVRFYISSAGAAVAEGTLLPASAEEEPRGQ